MNHLMEIENSLIRMTSWLSHTLDRLVAYDYDLLLMHRCEYTYQRHAAQHRAEYLKLVDYQCSHFSYRKSLIHHSERVRHV